MKIGRKREKGGTTERAKVNTGASKPAVNNLKRNLAVVAMVVIAIVLIGWVWNLGLKAEQTVKVAMWSRNVYKNEVITQDMVEPYEMLAGEFEKLCIKDNTNGTTTRRVVLWDEVQGILGGFAGYPLQGGTYVEFRSLIRSRVDNTDSVLYSFPGKDIVQFEIASEALSAFKTFLQPGDRLNIYAIYSEDIDIKTTDTYGNEITTKQTVYRSETAFGDIMIADMLNSQGESILDIYAEYNEYSTWQQAQLDRDSTFRSRTEPTSLLVALTPEEQDRYYYFLSKDNMQFKISLPQRSD